MNKLLWKTIHQCEFNKEDDYLARILNQAGIEDIYEFLHVNKSHTHDPFLLKNIKVGVDLLHSNLNKTIFIKRDPDVDGFTSAAYLNGFISDIAPDTRIIIGGSYQKEHGLKISDIEKYCDELSLIIIPDAGSGKESVNVYKEIREKYNIPILVIDHHEICEETMNYATVINCKDGEYPNNTLSGVGVVHKFCLAYATKYDINPKVCEYYLDLVSLGMIADSMDMRNLETRYYALEGIKEENIHNLLIKELAIKNEDEMKLGFTLNNIGWVIAPKINGVIRYGKKEEQDDLFRAMCGVKDDREYQPRRKSKNDPKPPVEIHSLQKTMARVCTNVKQRQDKDVRLYMNELDKEIVNRKLDKNSVIIIDATEIVDKKTVTGLVANKLAEKYYRPTKIKQDNDAKVLVCTNPSCKGKLLGRLSHFVSKKGMDIDGLSDETLKKFIELGWAKNIFDIYCLPEYFNDLSKMDGFGAKSVTKLQDAIEKSKTTDLQHFIAALSIPNIGTSQSKELCKIFKTWDDFSAAGSGNYDFSQLEGFGTVLTTRQMIWMK